MHIQRSSKRPRNPSVADGPRPGRRGPASRTPRTLGSALLDVPRSTTRTWPMAALTYDALFLAIVFEVSPRVNSGRSGWVNPRRGPVAERRAGVVLATGAVLQLAAHARAVIRGTNRGHTSGLTGLGGAAVGVGALWLAVAAQQALGAAWSTSVAGTGTAPLARRGPYRLVRHPVYTAFVGASTATTLMCPSVLSYCGVGLIVAGVELQVRMVEEPALTVAYGHQYRALMHRTGRLIPGLGALDA